MPVTTIITVVTAAASVLLIAWFLVRLWRLSLQFTRHRSRMLALIYSGAATLFGGTVIMMIVVWVQQSINIVAGDPGPVGLVLFLFAAAIACLPSKFGIAVMQRILAKANEREGDRSEI